MDKEKLRKVKEKKGLHVFLKLQTTISTSSMVLFDRNGCIKTYETVQDILEEFFQLRVDFYGKRKAYMENMMTAEASLVVQPDKVPLRNMQRATAVCE